MKILFIGGTGTISAHISKRLVEEKYELYLLNRGNRNDLFTEGIISILADINDEAMVAEKIKDLKFDCVVDFIAYTPEHLMRDYRLFANKTKQYIFISTASAYQKPLSHYKVTESTPLCNPYWQYSHSKIECEDLLMQLYREKEFPVTIVRPSYTYDERKVPLAVKGNNGSWQVIKRMMEGKPVIIQGDGTSLWTMTHSSDFAKAFVGLIANTNAIGESVHITSDEVLTWNQIYNSIAKALDVELKAVHISSEFLANIKPYDFKGGLLGDKAGSVVFDNSKIKRLVPGFLATKSFEQGVKETIDNILSHPELQKEDPEFDYWCDLVIDTITKASLTINDNYNN